MGWLPVVVSSHPPRILRHLVPHPTPPLVHRPVPALQLPPPSKCKRAALRSLFDRVRNVTLQKENLEGKNTSPLLSSRTVIPYFSSVPSPLPYRNRQHHQKRSQMRNQMTKDPRRMRRNNYWQLFHTWAVWVSGSGRPVGSWTYTVRVVFKSGPTLHSLLTKVKDLPKEKLADVVYQIPCQCGKV